MNPRFLSSFVTFPLGAAILCISSVANADSTLSLDLASAEVKPQLEAIPQIQTSLSMAPNYSPNAPVRFVGYKFQDVLKMMPPRPEIAGAGKALLKFVAADGFTVEFDPDTLPLEKGVLAFKDLDAPAGSQWKTFQLGKSSVTPAPYFLVWTDLTYDAKKQPWPFQLVRMEWGFAGSSDRALEPKSKDATVLAGYKTWKGVCVGCHSVNLKGGEVGSEFNVPRNITEYREKSYFRSFVKAPQSFRARSRMPAQPLSDSEMGAAPSGRRP
jgi:mono/diheme cytochrome c family protein